MNTFLPRVHQFVAGVAAIALAITGAAIAGAPATAAAPVHTISGTVTLPEGADPAWLAKVQVWAYPASAENPPTAAWYSNFAIPDAVTGAYSFPVPSDGEYEVIFRMDPNVAEAVNVLDEHYPNAHWRGAAHTLTVAGADITGIDATLDFGATVRGSVSLPAHLDSSYLDGFQVDFLMPDGARPLALADATGAFDLKGLAPGTYEFSVGGPDYFHTGFENERLNFIGADEGGTVTLDLGLGDEITDLELVAIEAGRLHGIVNGTNHSSTGEVIVTDAAGEFAGECAYEYLTGEVDCWQPEPGAYRLLYRDEAEGIMQYLHANDSATLFSLDRGEQKLDMVLDQRLALSRISGTLTVEGFRAFNSTRWSWTYPDQLGAPSLFQFLDGLWTPLPTVASYAATANGERAYSFGNLTAGTYAVRFGPTATPFTGNGPITTEWYPGVATVEEAERLELGVLTKLRGIDGTVRPVTPSVAPVLTDVAGNPFAKEIEWLAWADITQGWSNGDGTASFRPYANVNRDVMAAFLYRMAGEPDYIPPAEPTFTDVPTDHVFYTEIEWMGHAGIANGWSMPDGSREYRPSTVVRRDQMAAFLNRFGYGGWYWQAYGPTFQDVPRGRVFFHQIEWLAAFDISEGWAVPGGGREFRPTAPVKRDQMAAFLYRIHHYRR